MKLNKIHTLSNLCTLADEEVFVEFKRKPKKLFSGFYGRNLAICIFGTLAFQNELKLLWWGIHVTTLALI